MLIYGESGTGKSVYVDVLTALLGAENVSFVPLEQFADIHMVSDTYGKLLNICDESEEAMLDPGIENALKHYTGGTMYQFKRIYKEPFSAYPTAKIIITTNHLPKFKDSSEGVWRRMLLVPFQCVIPKEKVVLGLQEKIIANEMPGVLAWALEGARSLINGKFLVPEACRTAVTEYKKEMHPEYSFLEENFETTMFPDFYVSCKTVRNCYETWCKSNGYTGIKNENNLGKAVKKVFTSVDRERGRMRGQLQWFYKGLRIKPDSEFASAEVGDAE
jgi:putative DNA primase/helicase